MGLWSSGMNVLLSKARSQVRVFSRTIGVSSRVCKGKGVIAFWVGPNLVVCAHYAFWATIAVQKKAKELRYFFLIVKKHYR